MQVLELAKRRCIVLDVIGPAIQDATGARDLIEAAMSERAAILVVPVERLDPAFFQLGTGLLGEVVQKVLNYRMQFAVIGDISSHVAASDAFRDFVTECTCNHQVLFAADMEALEQGLAALRPAR